MKRNTLVLGITLFLLAIFAWAGWANWAYRKQAAAKQAALSNKAELVADASADTLEYKTPLVSKPAPAFTLEDLSGKKVSLADYKGKAVLLNFWATWCGPCKIETPWLIELRNKYASQGFEIVGISTEGDDLAPTDKEGWAHDKSAIADFVKQMKVPYPILINGDSLTKDYGGLDAMPTSFFIDRSGTIIAARQGLTSEDDIEANIQKSLGQGK